MTEKNQKGALSLNQNLIFQKRFWRAQRIGWGVLTVALLAALLGVFGSGPLSHTTVSDASGRLTITYERFARLLAPPPTRSA